MRKYCLNGLRFSRTFWGPKTGSFKLGTKKWLSTELNHILKNWRKIKHLRGDKNSDLPEYSIFHQDCLKKSLLTKSGHAQKRYHVAKVGRGVLPEWKVGNIESKYRSFVLLTHGTYSNDIPNLKITIMPTTTYCNALMLLPHFTGTCCLLIALSSDRRFL